MKLKSFAAQAALAAFVMLGASGAAFAQSDCKTLVSASPFGPDDEVGATNRVTPAVTKAADVENANPIAIAAGSPAVRRPSAHAATTDNAPKTTAGSRGIALQNTISAPLASRTGVPRRATSGLTPASRNAAAIEYSGSHEW